VTLLARSLEIGGAETQLVSLARGLDPHEFDVSVACLYTRGALLKDLEAAGIPVVSLQKKGRWDVAGFLPQLIKRLRQLDPDIVHAFLGPPNIFAAFAKSWLPDCRVIWGVRASNMDLSQYDWSWRLTRYLERAFASRADCIVANSRAGKDIAITNGLPGTSLTVIPNGIDTDHFIPDIRDRDRIRAEWNVPDDAYLIGKIARLDPMKGHATFLGAVARAAQNSPTLRFVCVGDGPADYAKSLREKGATLGLGDRVIWAGNRRDMVAIYNAVDAVTLTSDFGEGFPNAVGEAMACGRACVVTDVGDAACIVGDTGCVVPPGDAIAIAQAWQIFATESAGDHEARRCQSRDRICTLYSRRAMIDAHAALYRDAVGPSLQTAA